MSVLMKNVMGSGRFFRQSDHYLRRCISNTSNRPHSYEGDGKTNVTILNHEVDSPLMIDSYSTAGFRLNNGMAVSGPMAIFPRTVLSWNVETASDVKPESMSLFVTLEPKLDLLVIGVGEYGGKLPVETLAYLRKHKINVEVLVTETACTTFNFLNVERRCVAGAFIPPAVVKNPEDDVIAAKAHQKKLYSDDF